MNEEKIQELTAFFQEAEKPLLMNEIEEALNVNGSEEFKELVKVLNEMEERGLLVRTRTNRYGVPEKMNLIRGKVQSHAKALPLLSLNNQEKMMYTYRKLI